MLRTLVLGTLRGLRRNAGYTALNVSGLALGMACVLLIGLYVIDEVRYDRFHPSADRIAWVTVDLIEDGEVSQPNMTQGILAPALAEDLQDVEAVVRLNSADALYQVDGEPHRIEGVRFADASFFDVFDGFEHVAGERRLSEPGDMVLTESVARRLFGDEDPVGQIIDRSGGPLTVVGVIADPPTASSLQFSALIASSTMDAPDWMYGSWTSYAFDTYVRLRPGVTDAQFEAQLEAVAAARAAPVLAESGQEITLSAVPLLDARLRSGRPGQRDATALWTFGAIGLIVLLLACVNFTNLATARSLERAREVGVRKTLGAARSGLVTQFLVEAILLSLVALGLAVILVLTVVPWAEAVMGKPLSLLDLGPWLPALGLFAVFTGVLAGAYPAFVLSHFRPVDVLKGQFATGRQGTTLRRGLVVFQFAVTVVLLLGTVTVFAQLRHMQMQDLGFGPESDREHLVALDFEGDESVVGQLDVFKERLEQVPGVLGASSSITRLAGGQPLAGGGVEGPTGETAEMSVSFLISDEDFVSVYGLDVLAGRAPRMAASEEAPAEYVLNQTALRDAGYAEPANVLGKPASFWGFEGTVVGVVRDFHTQGLQAAIRPLAITASPQFQNLVTLRLQANGLSGTLDHVGEVWAELAPMLPYEPTFIDQAFGELYETERRFGRVFGLFAGLAIAIACLGLFGLAAHAAAQRRKEIGVRRVLGATVTQVVGLLTRDTLVLVGVAVAIGVPVAMLLMERWLDDFAYRTSIGVGVVGIAAALVVAVAVLTVGGQALRAAHADPVQSLRAD